MSAIDTTNKFLVAVQGANNILIMRPPRGPISQKDALLLAAYLVAISINGREEFEAVLSAVEST